MTTPNICLAERGLTKAPIEKCGRTTCGWWIVALFIGSVFVCTAALAQTAQETQVSTQTFHDPVYRVAFDYPANWNFSRRDGEISTFHLDARSALKRTTLRAVVAMPDNPFPASTFSGAYVYFSVTPHLSAASCARQAGVPKAGSHKPESIRVNDLAFVRGHDEQKNICITQRDEIYTSERRGSCIRFDLSTNNFCGGEVSGVKDITAQELDQVRARLESILSTIRLDPK